MPELKRGFGAAKMNKDADERTIPNGEYREALNIQITTSDESDVGTLQTLLGNTKIEFNTLTTLQFSNNAKCVGSIADERKNRIFYYVKDSQNFTDYIFQYNIKDNQIIPIVVDKYRVTVEISTATNASSTNQARSFIIPNTGGISNSTNLTNVRPGMKIIQASFSNGNTPVSSANEIRVINMKPFGTNEWQVFLDDFSDSGDFFNTVSQTSGEVTLQAPKALNLPDKLITGVNILDDTLFWTDNESEPKYLDVSCVNTPPSGRQHTRYYVKDKDGNIITDNHNVIDFRENPDYIKEEHLTVIKKSPLYPPTLLLSNTSNFRFNSGSISNLISIVSDNFVNDDGTSLESGTVKNVEFTTQVDYEVGDVLMLRREPDFSGAEDLDDFEIIVELLEFNPSASPNPTGKIKINFIKDLPGHTFGNNELFHTILQQEKPLYEFKFPRFAFRYKYQNSQYSPLSPFSEPAFIPGDFKYKPKDGFNLGMVNNLRSLYVMDFVPDEDTMPKDVIAVDILYKESNTNNIYIVKTIEFEDEEWLARGSDINTNAGDFARTKGALLITSEMVKSAIESNQILRPWDNVPRRAKAQELVGNRIVYANYVQNYNLK
jgi:ribosomal protein L35AE/L33A